MEILPWQGRPPIVPTRSNMPIIASVEAATTAGMPVARGVPARFYAPAFGYMLSEGITVCVMPMYGLALAFDHTASGGNR